MTYKCLYKHLFIHILLPFMTVYRDMNASIPFLFVISICSLSSRADIRSAPRLMTVCCSSPSEVATVTLYLSRMPNTVFFDKCHRLSRPALYTQPLCCGRSLSFRHCPSPCTHQTPAADDSPYSPGNPIKHPSAHLSPNQCLCVKAPLNPPMQILYYIRQLSGTLPRGFLWINRIAVLIMLYSSAVYHLDLHTHFLLPDHLRL